ncbi:MAG: hypothetical protein ACJAWM_000952 [Sulfitobacter sp.]|jgi:hypothetical protein
MELFDFTMQALVCWPSEGAAQLNPEELNYMSTQHPEEDASVACFTKIFFEIT